MGVKKLPKVKELQTEYAKLLEEKKKTYSADMEMIKSHGSYRHGKNIFSAFKAIFSGILA